MVRRCIKCKKELPESSKLPVCEYHKGVIKDNAKKVVAGAVGTALTAGVAAREKIGPIVKEKALPVVSKAIKQITKH